MNFSPAKTSECLGGEAVVLKLMTGIEGGVRGGRMSNGVVVPSGWPGLTFFRGEGDV